MLGGICALVLAGSRAQAQDKTFDVDNDGFIRNWLALPAIALKADMAAHSEEVVKPVFEKEYFAGQKSATPAEGGKVTVDNQEMAWKAVQTDNGMWQFEAVDNALYLGVTYVVCEQDIPGVILAIGSDDDSAWMLNGVEAIRVFANRGVAPDQNRSQPVTLKKGVNVLSLAVINGGGPAGACARFMDKDNNPVKNIKITLTPPAAAAPAAAPAAPAEVK